MKKSINVTNILLPIILPLTIVVSIDLTAAGLSALPTQLRQTFVTNEEAAADALRPQALTGVSPLDAGSAAASANAASPGLALGDAAHNVADADESGHVLGLSGTAAPDA